MKLLFKKILVLIKWLFYYYITIDNRNRYMIGESLGMKCHRLDQGLFSDHAYFTPTEKPEREYLTFKEFWRIHFPATINTK